jgi:ribosomal 50S subunit-associated protein YjgA (DUF615 family)
MSFYSRGDVEKAIYISLIRNDENKFSISIPKAQIEKTFDSLKFLGFNAQKLKEEIYGMIPIKETF